MKTGHGRAGIMIHPAAIAISLGVILTLRERGAAAQEPDSSAYAQAMARYSHNQLTKARVLFERAAQDSPANLDYQIWLAETERRIGMLDEAVQTARR